MKSKPQMLQADPSDLSMSQVGPGTIAMKRQEKLQVKQEGANLRKLNKGWAKKIDGYRQIEKLITRLAENQIEMRGSKRGQKPDCKTFKKQIDHLEQLVIKHELECKKEYGVQLSDAQKKERARRRNEISALECRVIKRKNELLKADEAQIQIGKMRQIINAIDETVDDKQKAQMLKQLK